MNYGFFLFKFVSVQDRDVVLVGGPWVVNDSTLALEPWSPEFQPSPQRLPRTLLWMCLPDLPKVCWNPYSLKLIAEKARTFIRMDDSTFLLMKGRFARVTVEVDTSSPP